MRRSASFAAILIMAFLGISQAAETLPLKEYLSEVVQKNQGVQSAQINSAGSMMRSHDGELLLAPNIFGNVTLTDDAKQTTNPLLQGDRTAINTYSLGVTKLTNFGLSTRLSYNINYFSIHNAVLLPQAQYHITYPLLELNQSLWRNWGGKETRATQEQITASALATSYSESFRYRSQISDAELAYWRLALARESIITQREILERAQKILDWTRKRVNLHLMDTASELQARAALELRTLELQAALDEERAASLAFNSMRGIYSSVVQEQLTHVDFRLVQELSPITPAKMRDDVKAAQQAQKLAEAAGRIGIEKDKPNLDAFGSLALNGTAADLLDSMAQSTGFAHRGIVVGVKFSAPLDFGTLADSKAGYTKEIQGAELNFQRKLFEQDQAWKDLTEKLSEAQKRLQLSINIEKVQKDKLQREQELLRQGRSTTYQVLLFEQDYVQAQNTRIRVLGEILRLHAQMKLFQEGTT